jgi:AGZA family xanthine/uracil permease-like MFS transporter
MAAFCLAVVFVVINGIPQLYLGKSLGMKLKPTGLAYFVGAIGNLVTGSLTPISAQAETISMAGLIKHPGERVFALLIAAIIGIILAITGTAQRIADFAGPSVMSGMMASVGLILCLIVVDFVKKDKRTSIISLVSACVIYPILLKQGVPNELIYTIAFSMALSIIDFDLIQKRRVEYKNLPAESRENDTWQFWTKKFWSDFKFIKPAFAFSAILGGLGIICLNIGSNLTFGGITASIAGTSQNFNFLTFINSLADIPSILFGGMPIEAIISGTAAAPSPITAGVVMMALAGILCFVGILGKIGKYVPAESIAGFLFIIAFKLTLVSNLASIGANSGNALEATAGAAAFGIGALTKNPFLALLAGILIRVTSGLFGLV